MSTDSSQGEIKRSKWLLCHSKDFTKFFKMPQSYGFLYKVRVLLILSRVKPFNVTANCAAQSPAITSLRSFFPFAGVYAVLRGPPSSFPLSPVAALVRCFATPGCCHEVASTLNGESRREAPFTVPTQRTFAGSSETEFSIPVSSVFQSAHAARAVRKSQDETRFPKRYVSLQPAGCLELEAG